MVSNLQVIDRVVVMGTHGVTGADTRHVNFVLDVLMQGVYVCCYVAKVAKLIAEGKRIGESMHSLRVTEQEIPSMRAELKQLILSYMR